MKEQFETAVPRRKFVVGDKDEARKTATGHSCKTLVARLRRHTRQKIMVESKYISDILDLLLDGDNEGLSARQQLPFITEDNFDYTGGGLFVRFSHSDEITKHKVNKQDLILNGVKIQTTEYPIEADATLFFKDGLINYLEIWCYLGDYPNQDLTCNLPLFRTVCKCTIAKVI